MVAMTKIDEQQLNREQTEEQATQSDVSQSDVSQLNALQPDATAPADPATEQTAAPVAEEGLEQAAEAAQGMSTVEMKKRKRKNIWGFVLTTVIFGLVVFSLYQLTRLVQGGDMATLGELFSNVNVWYLLAAVAVLLVFWLTDVLKYTLLNNSFGCKLGFKKDIKLALTGRYYECITPTGTGGQPMQIYYMYKNGVSGGKSTSVAMVKYTMSMFASMIVAAVVMGVFGKLLFDVIPEIGDGNSGVTASVIYIMGWVGFGINAFAPIFTVFVIFCPKFLKWLINLGLTLLHKMHIVKKLDERRAKIFKGIDDFAVCSQFIFKHPVKFLELLGLCLVEPICGWCVIPYLIIQAFCGAQIANVDNLFFTVAALSCFTTYGSTFIPTPGGSGAAENIFFIAFSGIGKNAIFWVTLIWRFFLYYSYIVMGIVMNIIDLTRKIVNARKEKKAAAALEAPPSGSDIE